MGWHFSCAQSIGGRHEQQDRLAIIDLPEKGAHLLVLADGMGGHSSGGRAAEKVIEVARQLAHSKPWSQPWEFLNQLAVIAHTEIAALPHTASRSPGSTCAFLLVHGAETYWAHVGDSRIYHLRDEAVVSHTKDHTVAQMLLDSQENLTLSQSNTRNQLYMRLGGKSSPEPDFGGLIAESGDSFLLCSDGFWGAMSAEILSEANRPEVRLDATFAGSLVNIALDRAGPQSDNISLVIAQWSRALTERLASSF